MCRDASKIGDRHVSNIPYTMGVHGVCAVVYGKARTPHSRRRLPHGLILRILRGNVRAISRGT